MLHQDVLQVNGLLNEILMRDFILWQGRES